MELVLGILGLLAVVAVLTVVGHGIWALVALLFRAIVGRGPVRGAKATETCFQCGRLTHPSHELCQWCARPWRHPRHDELNDLEAVTRQLARFQTTGALSAEKVRLYGQQVHSYRQRMLDGSEAAETDLARLLKARPISTQLGQKALATYDGLDEGQRSKLAPWVQFEIAKLLAGARREGDALERYQRLVEQYSNHPGCVPTALQGARLALRIEREKEARDFLTKARAARPTAEQAREILQLEQAIGRQAPAAPIIPLPSPAIVAFEREGIAPQAKAAAPPAAEQTVRSPEKTILEPAVLEKTPAPPAPADKTPSPAPDKVIPKPVAPKPPRRSLAEIMAAFMEERNIRWGELVGGLLIVGSSVALVISLWETLQTIPYVQFFLFVGVTAVLFGVGLYTEHRWKLTATSRSLLIIGTLLVPLNFVFVVMAGTSQRRWDPIAVVTQLASLAIFVDLVRRAGRVLVPTGQLWLVLAVVGNSALLLLIPAHPRVAAFAGLSAAAVACHAVAIVGTLWPLRKNSRLAVDQANGLFIFGGTASFALVISLGLNIVRSAETAFTADAQAVLAAAISLASLSIMAVGLVVMRGIAPEPDQAAVRTAGTATALVGVACMFGSVFVAWPHPAGLIAVGLVNFVALASVAVRCGWGAAHILSLISLALAYLTGFHWLWGNLPGLPGSIESASMLRALASAQSGTALVGLVVLLGAAAEAWSRLRRPADAAWYAAGAGFLAMASLSLITVRGFLAAEVDAPRSTFVYGIYAALCLALNIRWRRQWVSYVGLALAACTSLWALWCTNGGRIAPAWSMVVAFQALVFACAAAWLERLVAKKREPATASDAEHSNGAIPLPLIEAYRAPLWRTALAIAPLAMLLAFWTGLVKHIPQANPWQAAYVGTALCLLALYLLFAAYTQRAWAAHVAGAMGVGAAAAVTGWLHGHWFEPPGGPDLAALLGCTMSAASFGLAAIGLAARARTATNWDQNGSMERTQDRVAGVESSSPQSSPDLHATGGSKTRPQPPSIQSAKNSAARQAPPWYHVLGQAWVDTAFGAAFFAVVITLTSPALLQSAIPAWTVLLAAATALAAAWRHRQPAATALASILVWISLVHTLVVQHMGQLSYPWLAAMLSHATLAVLASGALRWALLRRALVQEKIASIYVDPLAKSGTLSSIVALPIVFFCNWSEPLAIALYLFWLSALWLGLAISQRSPRVFAAFQALFTLGLMFLTTAWLVRQPWVIGQVHGLTDPRSLHVYGLVLAAASLLWLVARIATRGLASATLLLDSYWLRVDRVVFFGVVGANLALAVWGVTPGVLRELSIAGTALPLGFGRLAIYAHAYGIGGWMVLGMLAAGLAVSLWHRFGRAELLAAVALAVTAGVMLGGAAGGQTLAASALRWTLAATWGAASAFVWMRAPLSLLGQRLGWRVHVGSGAGIVRAALCAGTVAPVTCLSVVGTLALVQRIVPLAVGPTGAAAVGLAAGLASLGPVTSYVLPLVLVMAVMIAHAVHERLPGYAFAAGAMANLAAISGYALSVVMGGGQLGEIEMARLIQNWAVTAALYTIAWLVVRARLLASESDVGNALAHRLLGLTVALSAFLNMLLLVLAFGLVGLAWPRDWVAQTGSVLGWISFVTACISTGYFIRQTRKRLRPEIVGLLGLAFLGLVACSVARYATSATSGVDWGFRTMMIGWALYAVAIAAATWWASTIYAPPGAEGPPAAIVRTAAIWVRVAGGLAVFLGLKAALFHDDDRLWGAAAIGLASAAGAVMAVWQRREGWAATAGLGVNLAASVVVWEWQARLGRSWDDWSLLLAEANVAAGAVVGLVWLAAARFGVMWPTRWASASTSSVSPSSVSPSSVGAVASRAGSAPLLLLQITLTAIGAVALLVTPLTALVYDPVSASGWIAGHAHASGWAAWTLSGAAAALYLVFTVPRRLLDALTPLTLGWVVLAACAQAARVPAGWSAFHVLIGGCIAVGTIVASAGWLAGRLDGVGRPASQERARNWLAPWFGQARVDFWVATTQVLMVALAVRGAWNDPQRPYWSLGAVIAASLSAGGMALWMRRGSYVYRSGLLLNVAAFIMWVSREPLASGLELVLANAIAFGLSASIWSWSFWPPKIDEGEVASEAARKESLPPYSHTASLFGSILLWYAVVWGVVRHLQGLSDVQPAGLNWAAWGLMALAYTSLLWDPRARFALPALYAAGIAGIVLAIQPLTADPAEFGRLFGLALAGYVLAWSAAGAARGADSIARALRIPQFQYSLPGHRLPEAWFIAGQAVMIMFISALTTWTSLEFDDHTKRLTASFATGLVLVAAVLMRVRAGEQEKRRWEYAAIALVVLVLSQFGWTWLDKQGQDLWMHRAVVLLAALGLASGVAAGSRYVNGVRGWAQAFERSAPVLASAAVVVLIAVLALEVDAYRPRLGSGLDLWASLSVPAVLLVLTSICVGWAVGAQADPLRLTARGRQGYVYAAEVLLVLICVHTRLSFPTLFQQAILDRFWTLIVLAIAFGGAGLSEIFQRKNLAVLSQPLAWTALAAPLLPALGNWHFQASNQFAGNNVLVLMLVGLFYGTQAYVRRSWICGLLAVISSNAALWMLWTRLDIDFAEHPQLWLIPVAVVGLVAEYLNRQRLPAQQASAIRYLALSVIYVSSTADVFISHVGQELSIPLVLVLMALSVTGVLSGILLQVRSFLYLGLAFLVVDLSIVVWHAAVDLKRVQVFWLACLLTGIAIIALFAFFEKRRNDVLLALEKFKQWQ